MNKAQHVSDLIFSQIQAFFDSVPVLKALAAASPRGVPGVADNIPVAPRVEKFQLGICRRQALPYHLIDLNTQPSRPPSTSMVQGPGINLSAPVVLPPPFKPQHLYCIRGVREVPLVNSRPIDELFSTRTTSSSFPWTR